LPSRAGPDPPAIPIDFIRLSVAEVRGFPDLASVERMTRERGAQAAAAEVFKEVAHSGKRGTFPAFAPARLAKTTQFFLDLVVAPLLMRTVFGEDLKSLRAQIPSHVEDIVAFFLAACSAFGTGDIGFLHEQGSYHPAPIVPTEGSGSV
jgi:hypothetical protein